MATFFCDSSAIIKRYVAGLTSLILLSSDTDLNAAAIAEGLTVDDPSDH